MGMGMKMMPSPTLARMEYVYQSIYRKIICELEFFVLFFFFGDELIVIN